MSRPTNPQVFNIRAVQAAATQVSNVGGQLAQNAGRGVAELESTVNRLGGGLGSGLNMAASAADAARELGTSLRGVSSVVNNSAGTFQGAVNAVENIATAVNTVSSISTGLSQFAGAVAGAAGAINDAISSIRGGNIPRGGENLIAQGGTIKLSPGDKNDWRVRIDCQWEIFGQNELFSILKKTGGVIWPYQPSITIATKANYTTQDITHGNYPFHSYKNSEVDDIQITGQFSAETEQDANYWIAATTFLKTATKMFFGQGQNAGNPPIVCILKGYGSQVFNNVPVIVKNFSVTLPEDVNYVRVDKYSTWVPIMSEVSVTVSPIYNRRNLRQFDLTKYARGEMVLSGANGTVGYL